MNLCNGYKMIWKPDHHRAYDNGCVYEHILVAEEKLGRELKNGEYIHHIDECKINNNPDNLMIFDSNASHTAFHDGVIPVLLDNGTYHCEPKVYYCIDCGKSISDKRAKRCFKCYSIYQRKVERPSNEELESLIKTNTFASIGRMYGVADNTIRKWCKSYGLPYRKKDIILS